MMSIKSVAYPTATIDVSENTSVSGGVDLGSRTLCGIEIPATVSGANLTFSTASAIDGTYVPLQDTTGAADYSIPQTESAYITVDPKLFIGIDHLKIESDSVEGADREYVFHTRELD